MYWKDEGYILSKSNFNEYSIILETFTLNHGKCSGIVYGGSSRKQKKNYQIGNKILLNFKSKSENKIGYLNCELLKPVSPLFFDDKKKSICILASTSILKILLPERQINKKIYESFEKMIIHLDNDDWILIYILWEFSLIKELGYEIDISDTKNIIKKIIEVNEKFFKIPKFLLNNNKNLTKNDIKEALIFNRSLIMENFILPNRLKFPISRNVLEKYYN